MPAAIEGIGLALFSLFVVVNIVVIEVCVKLWRVWRKKQLHEKGKRRINTWV